MTDAEIFEGISLFIAALRVEAPSQPRVHADARTFAAAVEKIGNAYCRRWTVYDTLSGRSCPDFRHGLSKAHAAGLIEWLMRGGDFLVDISPRMGSEILNRHADVAADVRELAVEYLKSEGR